MKYLFALTIIVALFASAAAGQEPNTPTVGNGITAWALLGTNPEFGKSEEVRLGYAGIFPGLELAGGVLHMEAPDGAVEEWAGRAYALFHAIDANMVAHVLGNGLTLPPGDIYGGAFAQYTYDRENEFSGGYVVGGLVDWPGSWQTVAEYQATLWNADDNGYTFVVGLRKRF